MLHDYEVQDTAAQCLSEFDVLAYRAECACGEGGETFIAQFLWVCAELKM